MNDNTEETKTNLDLTEAIGLMKWLDENCPAMSEDEITDLEKEHTKKCTPMMQ